MGNELIRVEFESVSGIPVVLDSDTVIKFCTRGNGKISNQEVALFLRTCQAKRLDPLENGEVYLIKYDDKTPAQIVVGKHAYLRRADRNPDYRGKKSGITVVRGNQVIQKEGCCVYDTLGEKLVGGWCRVCRLRRGTNQVEETFKEVAISEYSSGQANWRSKPGTMIEKVAISQCLREAFPNDYEGLYSEDEMIASGAIPAEDYSTIGNGGSRDNAGEEPAEDHAIGQDQRQALFRIAREHFDENSANDILKKIVGEFGLASTTGMTVSTYGKVMARLIEEAGNSRQDDDAPCDEGGAVGGEPASEEE